MVNITQGDALMIFYDGKSIGYCTANSVNMSTNMLDIASKDHGIWGAQEPGKHEWSISTDNLHTEKGFETVFDNWTDDQKVEIVFGYATGWETAKKTGLPESQDAWAHDTSKTYYKGDAYITSISLTANTGEKATFTAEFTGCGAFTKVEGA